MMLDGSEISPFMTLDKGDSTMKADCLKPFIFFQSLAVSGSHEAHVLTGTEQDFACV